MMIDCIQECGFSQVINFPTRRNNILDIFFTNRPSLIRKCHTLPGISDHEIIYLESSMKSMHVTKMSKHKILVWSRADITTIKSIAQNFNTCFLEKDSMTSPVNTL